MRQFIVLWFLFFVSISNSLFASEEGYSIKIGVAESGWAPFLFVENDQPKGYLADYISAISNETQINVTWDIVADRAELLTNVENGNYDIFFYGGNSSKYDSDYFNGENILPRYISAFSLKESQLELTPEKLESVKIALPKGTIPYKNLPNLEIIYKANIKESLTAVATGEADVAFADHAAGLYAIRSALLPDFEVQAAPKSIRQNYQPIKVLYRKLAGEQLKESFEAARAQLPRDVVNELQETWQLQSGQFINRNDIFTAEELHWIAEQAPIRVGGINDVPPFSYQIGGELKGYSVDYLSLISEITGLTFNYKYDVEWSQQLGLAKARNLDLLHMVRKRDDLSGFMLFSNPYLFAGPTVLYGRDVHERVESVERLVDKTVAVRRGYLEQVYLTREYPNLDFKLVESTGAGLNMVLTGEADFFICQSDTCDSYIYQNFISNLSVVGELGIPELKNLNKATFGVRSDWPELLAIINKAINAVSDEKLNKLKSRWLNKLERKQLLVETLSESEKRWVMNNKRLAFSLPLKMTPFAFVEDNDAKGIAKDLISILEQKYDLDASFINYDSWRDIVEAVINGDLDFVPAMTITEERRKKLLFTTPFIDMPEAIFIKSSSPLLSNLNSASGKTIGLVRGSLLVDAVRETYPQLTIKEYTTIGDTLLALHEGDIDITIMNPLVAQYHMTTLNLQGLMQTGDTQFRQKLAIAVHPSKPELVSLFNKVIASLDNAQMGLIQDKWSNLKVVNRTDWANVASISSSIIVLFIIGVLLANTMKRRKSLKFTNSVKQRLENAQRVAKVGSWDVDSDNGLHSLSREAANILGVAQTKTMSRIEYVQLISEVDRKQYLIKMEDALTSGLLNVEYRLGSAENNRWVKEVSELIFDGNGQFVSAKTTIQDISEFKAQQNELVRRQQDLNELTSKLLSVQEEERKRVARELHDDLSQRLAVLSIDLGAISNKLESDDNRQSVDKVKQDIVGIAEDTHSLSRRLHPSIIDDLGIIEALKSELQRFEKREQITTEFFCTIQILEPNKDIELVLFRVVQEALRNIAKYSEASKVQVTLAIIQDSIFLQVIDDGIGFDIEEARKREGLGLKSMTERAKLVDGRLHIESEEFKGVRIELEIPIHKNQSTS